MSNNYYSCREKYFNYGSYLNSRGYDKDLLPKNTPHYNQHQKNRLGPKKLGWPLTIFYYVMLVLAIAGIMWLIKHFLQQGMQVRASNQYDDFEE